jgi:hypothetical protein
MEEYISRPQPAVLQTDGFGKDATRGVRFIFGTTLNGKITIIAIVQ